MDSQRSQYYPHQQYNNIVYPQLLSNPQQDTAHLPLPHDRDPSQKQHQPDPPPKSESKPQATFLTKLYALLERPENHHMIRWDAAGDHIIVEKPEQLALHVLPSIYRQSRFASFSRQLNIYGFMRKVNLRNVDPAIDDPDASTWSHPTLNRHSPAEVVANFKRRVPPRLPKARSKRPEDMSSMVAPRSAVGLAPVSLTVPSSMPAIRGRARGFSAPGAFVSGQVPQPHWNSQYSRTPLPPLTVPSDAGGAAAAGVLAPYGHPSAHLASPTDDSSSHSGYSSGYPTTVRESTGSLYLGSSPYGSTPPSSQSSNSWEFPPLNTSGMTSSATPHPGPSLSSLLNHPSGGTTPAGGNGSGNANGAAGYGSRLSISTSQVQPFNSLSMPSSSSSLSPDSRPTTGYSGTSSMSSLPYEPPSPSDPNGRDYDHSHSHHSVHHHHPDSRPLTPGGSLSRPPSAHKGGLGGPPSYGGGGNGSNGNAGNDGLLGLRQRGRRHSQAVSPYPSPYDSEIRPLSAPDASNLPRTKSLMALSDNSYYVPPAQAEFAYSPAPNGPDHHNSHVAMDTSGTPTSGHWNGVTATTNRIRPSTSQSSLSAASHSSSSAANTPPTTMESYPDTTDMHRCEYDTHPPRSSSPSFHPHHSHHHHHHHHHHTPSSSSRNNIIAPLSSMLTLTPAC